MKTAEEWHKQWMADTEAKMKSEEWDDEKLMAWSLEHTKQIQLDAIKKGMMRQYAFTVAKAERSVGWARQSLYSIADDLKRQADQLTINDL